MLCGEASHPTRCEPIDERHYGSKLEPDKNSLWRAAVVTSISGQSINGMIVHGIIFEIFQARI